MFTGIIQEVGKVEKIKKSEKTTTFTIKAANVIKGKKVGQSIAVNGVCTTIIKLNKNSFEFDALTETMEISNLSYLKEGDEVNLEPALTLNQSLDGHLVQGHVDAIGKISAIKDFKGEKTFIMEFPKEIAKYLAFKGSITVNGISLTISNLQEKTFSVEITPHTLEKTNLKNLKSEDKVNLETDLIARHLEQLLKKSEEQASYEFLRERGLIY